MRVAPESVRIDLNADVGEWSAERASNPDLGVIPHITSANIACGFHAGDPAVMRATVEFAREHGVAVGAHPGFPDPEGFGRRELQFSAADVEYFVAHQIGALAGIAAGLGVRLQHVKPHGALFNMAVRDTVLADAVARAAATIDRALILFGLPGSEIVAAGRRAGLRTASEGFADRAYASDGTLVPRSRDGAVIHDPAVVVRRGVRMVIDRTVEAVDGTVVPVTIDSLCVHGDTPGAADLASRLRAALVEGGVDVKAVGRS